MDVEVNISGLAETQRAIYDFSERLGDKVTLLALRLGGNFMLKNIRNAEPKKTGRLRRATVLNKSKINQRRRNGKVGLYIVVKKGKKRDDQKGAYYAGWVEYGHNTGSVSSAENANGPGRLARDYRFRTLTYRRAGAGRHIQGVKFLRNTFEQNKERSRSIILQAIEDGGRQLVRQISSR